MMNDKKLLLLQINDALFPIGGYAHSYGLETYIQKELVIDEETATSYIRQRLLQTLCYTDLLSIKLAYEAVNKETLAQLMEIEELIEAANIPSELRTGSKKLGIRFIKALDAMETSYHQHPLWKGYREHTNGQYAVAYGTLCAVAKIDRKKAMTHFLYAQVSAMVTNCVKSIPLKQSTGQKLLYSMYQSMDEVLEKVELLTKEQLYQSTPGFDIRSMQHEYLYSRMYMS